MMGTNGSVDTKSLREFRKKLESSLSGNQINLFIESCAKELAARLLAKVIKRTPVHDYSKDRHVHFVTKDGKVVDFEADIGKKGGTLRRGWTGEKSQSASTYVNSLKVNHFGDVYVIEIVNPVEYAPYVEYGHRTRGGDGWVEGKFMLTIPEQEIQRDAPRILENKLKKKLGECFK
jgi:hypothetical protein